MSYESRKTALNTQIIICMHTLKNLLGQLQTIEEDTQTSVNDKLFQIKKIQAEITKVGTEIDSIKKDIMLLSAYNVN
jgi:peptidoglycan hydrolase CwlO-like protein